jgi:hypothetical protein
MGDASQARQFRNSSASDPRIRTAKHDPSELDTEFDPEIERIAVLYSHNKHSDLKSQLPPNGEVCHSFDELLLFLEDDRVESIWFDETVNPHEKAYISGWARIFRPELTTHKLQCDRVAN